MINSLIPDIIDYILVFLDDKSYVNCLKTSTIFHTHRLNLINYGRYVERLPKRLKLKYIVVEIAESEIIKTRCEIYYLEPDRTKLGKINFRDAKLKKYLEITLYKCSDEQCPNFCHGLPTTKTLISAEIISINNNRLDHLRVILYGYTNDNSLEYIIKESVINCVDEVSLKSVNHMTD